MNAFVSSPASWLVLVALPTLVVPLLFVGRTQRWAVAVSPFAGLPLLVLSWLAPLHTSVSLPWLLLDTHLATDVLVHVFLPATVLLWCLAGVSIRAHIGDFSRARRLHVFHLLAMTGNLGLIVAADLASLYFFFTLMSFAAYGLILHERHAAARRAARIYVAFTVFAELPLFGGILMTAARTEGLALDGVALGIAQSPHATLICTLLLVGFGVKAGALLLHMWLPLAYSAAPTPSSAALGGAMINAGLVGWIRVLPLGVSSQPALASVLMGAGIVAAFYGVLLGVVQRDPKALLGYSSISQMGLVTLAVGVALAEPSAASVAVGAAALFAVHHGLAKGALFLGVGVARRRLGRAARIAVAAGLVLLVLSISGLPLTSGAIAKKALEGAVHEAPGGWSEWLPMLVSLSSAATLVLLVRFLACARVESGREALPAGRALGIPWGLATVLALGILWVLPWLGAPEHARKTIGLEPMWSSTWPAALGLAVALGAHLVARRTSVRLPEIPPGDLAVLFERAIAAMRSAGKNLAAAVRDQLSVGTAKRLRARARTQMRRLVAGEKHAGWTAGALLLIALVTVFTVIAARCDVERTVTASSHAAQPHEARRRGTRRRMQHRETNRGTHIADPRPR